jgi:catechol 2,3-dioxygenase-like lactoylglutathione lyase family enzyme
LTGPGGGYGFRFFSPDGLPFEVSSDVVRGDCGEVARWDGVPIRISHIVLHSPDHRALSEWFVDVLGFKVSDWLGDFMCFLRCNTAHHRIAILPGPPCLNHVAYDMHGVDGMMRGIHRLKQQGTDIAWGPGRHTAGNNTFSYFATPNGFAVEYAWQSYDGLTQSPRRELKIFTEREGGVEHVGADNMSFGRDYIADWFAETLGGHIV